MKLCILIIFLSLLLTVNTSQEKDSYNKYNYNNHLSVPSGLYNRRDLVNYSDKNQNLPKFLQNKYPTLIKSETPHISALLQGDPYSDRTMSIQSGSRVPGNMYVGSPGFIDGEFRVENGPRSVSSLAQWSDSGNTNIQLVSNLPKYPQWKQKENLENKNRLKQYLYKDDKINVLSNSDVVMKRGSQFQLDSLSGKKLSYSLLKHLLKKHDNHNLRTEHRLKQKIDSLKLLENNLSREAYELDSKEKELEEKEQDLKVLEKDINEEKSATKKQAINNRFNQKHFDEQEELNYNPRLKQIDNDMNDEMNKDSNMGYGQN